MTHRNITKPSKQTWAILGASTLTAVAANFLLNDNSAKASDIQENIHAPHYPWGHVNIWQSFDHASIRRGFQVYYNIGKACHSMDYVYFRELVGVALTEEEAKAISAETEYDSEPNDEGDILKRPGTLNDPIKSPYRNENEARFMNNGAVPPDLSLIVNARHQNEDYIFALLTGYRDAPHGLVVAENMHYNPYFPGGQISMPPPLTEGAVEFDDGTEASVCQMAKDVVTYLTWSSNPELDERHLMGLKTLTVLVAFAFPLFYYKTFLFTMIKNRKIAFVRRTEKYKQKIRKNF